LGCRNKSLSALGGFTQRPGRAKARRPQYPMGALRTSHRSWAQAAKLPGSRMVPSARALRASLALKLWSIERKSHVMALVADEGLALFCGLNTMPKKRSCQSASRR
jgi:hypothetical protein